MATRSSNVRFFESVHGVYFDDLDAFQILHNARYLLLLERTLGAFWQKQMGWGSWHELSQNIDAQHLVKANHIEYHEPVFGTGEVRVRVWVEKLGETSLSMGFSILPMDQDRDHANGTRVLVRIDPATKRPVPWSAAFRAKIAPYLRTTAA